MSSDVSLAVVTAVLGLVTAGLLALINNWINVRAGSDENLRALRLGEYPALWKATAAVPRWPRATLDHGTLDKLHRTLRAWYYGKGGLFLSEQARLRYGDVQELIAQLLATGNDADAGDVLVPDRYRDLMETASALRTALTEDLDTRRRKSMLHNRRRSRWHAEAAKAAEARIACAKGTESKHWQSVASEDRPKKGTDPGRSSRACRLP